MINTILVATDGSSHARKALDLAIEFSKLFEARLVVMHVIGQGDVPAELIHMAQVEHIVEPPATDPAMPRASIPHADVRTWEESGKIHAYIANKLLGSAEDTAKEKNVGEFKTVAAEGDPAKSILETAEAEKADMIVMGSRGLGNLKGMLVGSVSNKVNHLAGCTCVCVK